MSYVVLARKWRPQNFADLVGQEHVSRTLANAIATDRVAHAFLFTGVRGVGKTTSARILAKALNCAQGPTATPCLSCPQCVEIGEGSDVDVREIDGASYNGIEEVRRLQEGLPYQPSRDRFKIYIVDEVHMLSTAAWNAFLKTLEEPPPHVKFIFATTEVNKVPVTILSRCQRYDFKLIGIDAIATRLNEVLSAEKVTADDAAVRIIAREAAGSMRDAMSLLDQVIAWLGGSDDRLTSEGVARVLGVASRSVLHQLGDAVVTHQPVRCIEVIEGLAEQGFSLSNVARDFLQYLRDLVVASVSDDPARLVDLADSELQELSALAKHSDTEDLSRLYLGFSRALDDIVRSAQPRGALEMALVRLSRRPPLLPVDELLRKLAEMERRLAGSAAAGGSGAGGGSASRAGGGRPDAPRAPETGAQHAAPPQAAPPQAAPPQAAPPQAAPPQAAPPQQAAQHAPAAPAAAAFQPPRLPPAPPAPAFQAPKLPSAPPAPAFQPPKQFASPAPAPPAARTAGSPAAASPSSPPPAPRQPPPTPRQLPPAGEMAAWEAILRRVDQDNPRIAACYRHAAPLRINAGELVIGFVEEFIAQQATDKAAVALLEDAASAHFGEPTQVRIDVGDNHRGTQTVAQKLNEEQQQRLVAARRRVEEHPAVLAAIELLGAELRDVRLPQQASM